MAKSKNSSGAKPTVEKSARFQWADLQPFGLAALAGVLYFVGFAGFDVWPLSFVAVVPFLFALDLDARRRENGPRVVRLGLLFGFITNVGGYYWLVEMLDQFSGFPMVLNIPIAAVLWFYQGALLAVFAWLWWRARSRGWNATLCATAAFGASELAYPLLFPSYYANALHSLPAMMQVADVGGPILLSMVVIAVNGAVYEVARAVLTKTRIPRITPLVASAALAATLVYGAVRVSSIDAMVAKAPKVTVGVVQTNMGIFSKREDPFEGHRRHIEQTLELETEAHPDLVVWPESAYTFFLPEGARNLRRRVLGPLRTPILFGGLAHREIGEREHFYNTAYIVDANGDIRGTYDKTYLLAFGEYIPFGETFPVLYEMSPNTGHFTPGNHVRPLPFGRYRISVLICYEDILPGFVLHAVDEADPHLLVNITNDAWFGDTNEPWVHMALAKFRAVEHHRYLVRATNSGVSAIIDPVGRVIAESGVFTRENLDARVAMMRPKTLYQTLGNWPAWLALAFILTASFLARPSAGDGIKFSSFAAKRAQSKAESKT